MRVGRLHQGHGDENRLPMREGVREERGQAAMSGGGDDELGRRRQPCPPLSSLFGSPGWSRLPVSTVASYALSMYFLYSV